MRLINVALHGSSFGEIEFAVCRLGHLAAPFGGSHRFVPVYTPEEPRRLNVVWTAAANCRLRRLPVGKSRQTIDFDHPLTCVT